jgi:hypothetical protein
MSDHTFTVIEAGAAVETGADEGLHLAQRAEAAGRPVAVDRDERVAYLGVSAKDRAGQLASLEAPDFTLPDVDGRLYTLSDHRGKKVFLVAYASW